VPHDITIRNLRYSHNKQISAIGPLLSGLRATRDINRILTVQTLTLGDYMFLDENTLKGLSICSSDQHGFVHARSGREGLSLLGTYSFLKCQSVHMETLISNPFDISV
jgi:DNA mismatch repair ATPase MutS